MFLSIDGIGAKNFLSYGRQQRSKQMHYDMWQAEKKRRAFKVKRLLPA
jgi:hypothetical protein